MGSTASILNRRKEVREAHRSGLAPSSGNTPAPFTRREGSVTVAINRFLLTRLLTLVKFGGESNAKALRAQRFGVGNDIVVRSCDDSDFSGLLLVHVGGLDGSTSRLSIHFIRSG